ncbi:cupin domain-containing protein [Amycolatopsis methanolica]|uniref:Putative cupin domain protein n=1 Tax=Amycolatopsis methanolica 239 TaxID=1068978 RepID=A0A076MUY1_AMYME|nr:AraC family ligand binding domain-containing protein [Amycolatopsis methanolica]AIJ21607.1 putative cupin domain protein [Amycolatopsis methanolica 239]
MSNGFVPHTHPGHHVLVVTAGIGTITYAGRIHETRAGQVYLIDGEVPHAVGAITDRVILAVGSPHRAIDAEDRMAPVPYEEVVSLDGELCCLICDVIPSTPRRPHDVGCPHCPCHACAGQNTGSSAPARRRTRRPRHVPARSPRCGRPGTGISARIRRRSSGGSLRSSPSAGVCRGVPASGHSGAQPGELGVVGFVFEPFQVLEGAAQQDDRAVGFHGHVLVARSGC